MILCKVLIYPTNLKILFYLWASIANLFFLCRCYLFSSDSKISFLWCFMVWTVDLGMDFFLFILLEIFILCFLYKWIIIFHLFWKTPSCYFFSRQLPPLSTANNGNRMLCHYIQKQDNLKLNGCPLQCPQVQPHGARPELRPLQKASPPQPQRQARNIKSFSRLFCSFYKL